MPSQITARAPGGAGSGATPGAVERRAVTVLLVLLGGALAALSTRGLLLAGGAAAVAAYFLLLAVVGRERTATFTMGLAFATAPMYKGLLGRPDASVTPTDLLIAVAVVLLLPSLIHRLVRVPPLYLAGVVIILVTGTLSTVFSPEPFASAFQFGQWMVVLVGLVGLVAVWAPSWTVVSGLLWCFVAGQAASFAKVLVEDPPGGRHDGLAHHTNAFGEAGLMAFAALMYLWTRSSDLRYRLLVVAAGLMSVQSVVMSGSRAATVVIAGLVLMIPFVERSAWRGFLLGVTGALFLFVYPYVVDTADEGSALSRLAGTVDAAGADIARSEAQERGIEAFLQSPVAGTGFAEALYIHNIPLAVLSSIGVIGMVGYLFVLFTLARPIIGNHPQRRLAYIAWAFIAITPTVPGLEDRTLWLPLSLVILLALREPLALNRARSRPALPRGSDRPGATPQI